MPNFSIFHRVSVIFLFFLFFALKGNGQMIYYGSGFNVSNGTTINIDKYDENYYTGSYGVHLKTSHKLNYKLRLVPKLAFFLPKTKDLEGGKATTMLADLNVNLYKINNPEDLIRTYIFGGVNFSGWYLKDDSKNPEDQINLNKYGLYPGVSAGAGFKFNIKHDMELFIEGKYLQYLTVMSGQIMGSVGVNMILD